MAKKQSPKKGLSDRATSKDNELRKIVPKKKGVKKYKLKANKGLGLYIRIKSFLWQKFKDEFKGIDYSSKNSLFLSVTHQVYLDCKGLDCSDDDLTLKYRRVKKKLKEVEYPLDPNVSLGLYVRIKSLLWKEFGKDFKGIEYRTKGSRFLNVVHDVYLECRVSGSDCTDEVLIRKYIEIIGRIKRPEPFIEPDLYRDTDGHEYWNISTIEFNIFTPYLWIVSPMIISPPKPEFQVSEYLRLKRNEKGEYDINKEVGYDRNFKQWVDWCNYNFRNISSDGDIPYFMFTKPEWNEDLKRWETEIYITDKQGRPDSFGFIPKGGIEVEDLPEVLPDFGVEEEEVKPTKRVKKEKVAPEPKIETESERLLNKKLGYIEEVRMWKELGDEKEMKNAILKLKITNKQIDKLK